MNDLLHGIEITCRHESCFKQACRSRMLRWLIGYKMEEVIESKYQVEEPEQQSGDKYSRFHENFFALVAYPVKVGNFVYFKNL